MTLVLYCTVPYIAACVDANGMVFLDRPTHYSKRYEEWIRYWLPELCHSHSMQCNAFTSQVLNPVYNFIIVVQLRHISSESAVTTILNVQLLLSYGLSV